jgi:Ca-activated chloride channel family protein
MIKNILIAICSFFIISSAYCDFINISQIDNSELLLEQNVKVYVNILDNSGKPLKGVKRSALSVSESSDGVNFEPVKINGIEPEANYENGINFLLLVDNSGSMYWDINGNRITNDSKRRISAAKNAVINLLNSMENPRDRVGIASFNTYYTLYTVPVNDKGKIENYLDEIKKPLPDEDWTEIYSSIFLASENFEGISGRKVIILLTDGVNEPYYLGTGKPHPKFGTKVFSYQEDIDKCLLKGCSVFAIKFGPHGEEKDTGLSIISRETGGMVFDASNEEELKSVYSKIRENVLNELQVTYRAGMEAANKKFVKVEMNTENGKISSTRYYYASIIFGVPLKRFTLLLLLPILLALIFLWILSLIKFKNRNRKPLLEVLDAPLGTVISKTFELKKNATVIGGSSKADMTIINAPAPKDEYATIVYDEKTKVYAIKSKDEVMVNNKPVRTRILESGDVINTGGVTIVFDAGDSEKKKK